MNNPNHISESLETIFWAKIHKFFEADTGSGIEKIRIRDGKNSNPGSGTEDKHSGSATLANALDIFPGWPETHPGPSQEQNIVHCIAFFTWAIMEGLRQVADPH
jgi:hypothetical protein